MMLKGILTMEEQVDIIITTLMFTLVVVLAV